MKNNHSIEKIHHFRCNFCDKWWSIADAPDNKNDWYCPWCGQKNQY